MKIVEEAKVAAQTAMQTVMSKLVPLAPDKWIPGGVPDPLIRHKHGLIGTAVSRLDGPLKVTMRSSRTPPRSCGTTIS